MMLFTDFQVGKAYKFSEKSHFYFVVTAIGKFRILVQRYRVSDSTPYGYEYGFDPTGCDEITERKKKIKIGGWFNFYRTTDSRSLISGGCSHSTKEAAEESASGIGHLGAQFIEFEVDES